MIQFIGHRSKLLIVIKGYWLDMIQFVRDRTLGKYTLYSCYGIMANCNALPVLFGIVFENEDKEGWELFSKFMNTHHPIINYSNVTDITYQQKGSIKAMHEVLPLTVNFFCSYHWKKIIEIHIKSGKGEYSWHL
jgi:hypothetical protein